MTINPVSREEHTPKGLKIITGGLKEFLYSNRDLERIEGNDTEYTKAFKKSYWLERYFANSDKEAKTKLRKYAQFYKVTFRVMNKQHEPIKRFHIDIEYELSKDNYRNIFSEDCSESFSNRLPNTKYRVTITRKILLLFKKRQVEEFELTKNLTKEIIF